MTTFDNALSYVKDQMQQGKITAEEANVEIVRMMGIRVVTGSLPAQVRKALNAGVKSGKICRLPKKGIASEIYYHPNSRTRALEEQSRQIAEGIAAIKSICI